ncbi:MAG: hypothetical protein ACYCZD_04255 [Rhodanobacter sp.]
MTITAIGPPQARRARLRLQRFHYRRLAPLPPVGTAAEFGGIRALGRHDFVAHEPAEALDQRPCAFGVGEIHRLLSCGGQRRDRQPTPIAFHR